jgi:hypothetical protein
LLGFRDDIKKIDVEILEDFQALRGRIPERDGRGKAAK